MSDRQQDQGTMYEVPEREPSQGPANPSRQTLSVPFRLTADFVVEIDTAAKYLQQPDLTPEERRLLLTVLTTPEALNRMCRLAIVSDLEREPGLLEDQFFGPQSEDILAAILPYLASEDQRFWSRLRHDFPENLGNYLLPMFCEFKTILRRVMVVDAATGEAIPHQVRCDRIL
jgi:hypothetical protein